MIVKASLEHLNLIVPLFDQYRIFYRKSSDLKSAKHFIEQRIINNESVLFLALENGDAVGFTQLYPSFSSVSMQALYILNDLYVAEDYRGKGVGKELLIHAQEYCKAMNYKGLALETEVHNPAKRLYEKLNWKKDKDCFHYFWKCE